MEESIQQADSTPQTNDASKGTPRHEVPESASKHNVDNQDRSQEEAITSTSASTSESTVKSTSHHKVSPSPANQSSRSGPLHSASLQLEESLKEKVGFSLHSHRPSPTKPVIHDLEQVIPRVTSSEDSNKVSPSKNLSAPAALSGSVQNVLFTTRETRKKKTSSNWCKEQTSDGGSKSGSVHLLHIACN